VAAEESVKALFAGLTAGVHKQVCYAGVRMGFYAPVRDAITGPLPHGENPSFLSKILAGMITGVSGITVANPFDLAKVKLQAQGARMAEGSQLQYKNTLDCYTKLFRTEGLRGGWIGWGPNASRYAIVAATEIASYD